MRQLAVLMPVSHHNASSTFLSMLRQGIFEPLSASENIENRNKHGLDVVDVVDVALLQRTCRDAYEHILRPVSADINHLMP